ncbi:MAG: diaminopimelate epimerase [Desulfarculaceae bacterium]|nr:diaminopimelate epimerase [Desulfarculaceae bacterium]
MDIRFTKMEGLGNDFILLDDRDGKIRDTVSYDELSKRLCSRHFGIGADGIIAVGPSETHDFTFTIFNSDGSRAQMCGNGMRCFAKYLYENAIIRLQEFTVATDAGTVVPKIFPDDRGRVQSVRVDMGEPVFAPARIPFVGTGEPVVGEKIRTEEGEETITVLSMGNPHAVVFVDDISGVDIEKRGRALEKHERFPAGTNTEFIQVLNSNGLVMKVWERGAGLTLACGTGACAALVAARLNNLVSDTATVHLDGGDLAITWNRDNNHVYKTGPAQLVFTGVIRI